MAGRGGDREGIGRKYGMKPADEPAVLRALRWLQSQQHADGTWGSRKYHNAFTGLALLCFLGHGETPEHSPEFSVVVTNAINALIREGNETESRFGGRRENFDKTAPYQHGICTYALAEAYVMTRDPKLEPILRRAVEYIVRGQRMDGGWAYSYDTGPDLPKKEIKSDTSVSGWQIQALKVAHMAGLPGLEDVDGVLNKP